MPTREQLDDRRWKVTAVVGVDQLRPIVAAGAVVELQMVVDPQFPRDRIMSSQEAKRALNRLERQLRADK